MENLLNQFQQTNLPTSMKTEDCESLQQHELILISDSETDTKYNLVPRNVKQKKILTKHSHNYFNIDISDSEESVIIIDSDQESSAIEEDDLLLGRMNNKDTVKNENSKISKSTRLEEIPPFEGTFHDYKRALQSNQSKQQEISEEKWAKYFFEPMPTKLKIFYDNTRRLENFDICKLQKSMSQDTKMWMIMRADKEDDDLFWDFDFNRCSYYNRRNYDYRDPEYREKRCHLCGTKDHNIKNCSQKICFTCGSMHPIPRWICAVCCARSCNMCHSIGHYADQCPDLWRRFHQTTTQVLPKNPGNVMKPSNLLHCCHCSKRGHESSTCKLYMEERKHHVTPASVTNYTNWPQLTTNYEISTSKNVCTTSIEQLESTNFKSRRNNKRPFPKNNINDEFTHRQKRSKKRKRKKFQCRKEFVYHLKTVNNGQPTTIGSYYL